jgi:polyisoprenoid-binding protein YceI
MNPSARAAASALLALALGACATAASVLYPVNENAFKARAGDYTIDPAHTTVIFAVDHLGFSTYYGRFNEISGRLTLDTEHPEKSEAAVRIAAASLDTPSDALDEKLKASEMFDAARHPEIVFATTRVVRTGDNAADVEGMLTVKGVSKPVTLKATFHGSGTMPLTGAKVAGFDAKATIKRSEFGLDAWKGFVGDEVSLIIAAEFAAAKG